MLRIRQEQLDVLMRAQEKKFIKEMAAHLRTYFEVGMAALADEDLRQHIERAFAKARGYGLTSKQDLCRFLNLCASHGWDFDEQPHSAWMRAILDDAKIGRPRQRLQRLVDRCLGRNEDEGREIDSQEAGAEWRLPRAMARPQTPVLATDEEMVEIEESDSSDFSRAESEG